MFNFFAKHSIMSRLPGSSFFPESVRRMLQTESSRSGNSAMSSFARRWISQEREIDEFISQISSSNRPTPSNSVDVQTRSGRSSDLTTGRNAVLESSEEELSRNSRVPQGLTSDRTAAVARSRPTKTVCDSKVPDRLRRFASFNADLKSVDDGCAICIDGVEMNKLMIRLDCNHLYCSECISEWFEQKPTCPVCRKEY